MRHDSSNPNGLFPRQPSALFPIGMSLAATALVIGHAAIFGITHEADEGAAAHIFQILMVAQVPIVAFFAIRWFPRRPRQTLFAMALQALAALCAIAAVYWLT